VAEEQVSQVALYRKYRPQSPEEVVGQEHVVRALVGSVHENRLSHAFLFCGPRGTGKTSTARILAKMVNCEQGPTAEPCGVCGQCVAIREGSHLDVVEIDAASHGGVEDARDLRERAPTAPAMGREKVYIIDEAQRLSREAFDALLKVLEEPPPGVRFVLATTEPHKMPATIIGRTQRFDFRRVSTDAVADHLERVAKEEGMVLVRGAAELLARQSEGSMRDALSLLDQCSVLGGPEITEDVVQSLIGAAHTDIQFELGDAVAVRDTRSVFDLVDRLVQEGQDLRFLTGQVLGHFRDLMLVRSAPDEPAVIDAGSDRHARLVQQAMKFSIPELSRVIGLLLVAQTDLRWTTSPRLTFELALVRATVPDADPSPAGLAARIERLERLADITTPEAGRSASAGQSAPVVRGAGSPGQSPPVPRSVDAAGLAEPSEDVEVSPDADRDTQPVSSPHAPAASSLDVTAIRRSWQQLLDRLQERRQMILFANLSTATPASYDGATLELAFPPGKQFAVQKVQAKDGDLRAVFAEVFGVSPEIRCVARDDVPGSPAVEVDTDDVPSSKEEAIARLRAQLGGQVEVLQDGEE
jgi:DNA polymerase-3 subunit gamma/tau